MKKFIIACIVSLQAIGLAHAADALIPVTAPPTFYNWSGVYIGAHGGHAWDRTQGTTANLFNDLTDQKFNGWLGGGQIGINHQIGRVVLGLELSGSWSGANGNSDCFVTRSGFSFPGQTVSSCSATQDWSAQLLARLGYAPGDGRFLPYLLGGVGLARLNAEKQVTFTGSPPVGFQPAITTTPWGGAAVHQGLLLGVGAQYAITPWVSVGFEYLYGIYGTQEHGGITHFTSITNFGPLAGIFTSSGNPVLQSPQNLTTQSARFVINFKLD
jgi:outer membrane immunogenic protein